MRCIKLVFLGFREFDLLISVLYSVPFQHKTVSLWLGLQNMILTEEEVAVSHSEIIILVLVKKNIRCFVTWSGFIVFF